MTPTPFHLRYPLSRGQRLVPLLRIEGVASSALGVCLLLFFVAMTVNCASCREWWGVLLFGGLALLMVLLNLRLFRGLLDVLLVPVRHMDVLVEENAAGFLIGPERWYLFLDSITELRKYRDDTWTVRHSNGHLLHIAASAISDDQVAHLRAAMERGRTPEGIRAVIERGRRIAEIERSLRER